MILEYGSHAVLEAATCARPQLASRSRSLGVGSPRSDFRNKKHVPYSCIHRANKFYDTLLLAPLDFRD